MGLRSAQHFKLRTGAQNLKERRAPLRKGLLFVAAVFITGLVAIPSTALASDGGSHNGDHHHGKQHNGEQHNASGSSYPWAYTFDNNSGPDSGYCTSYTNAWANDRYSRTFVVIPQVDGSYLVDESFTGRFVTIAGNPQPNASPCGATETGGVKGNYVGTESFKISGPVEFNPEATCVACNATTTNSSSAEAGNAAFVAAFFPGGTYSGVGNFDFRYTTEHNGSWIDSIATPQASSGNITG